MWFFKKKEDIQTENNSAQKKETLDEIDYSAYEFKSSSLPNDYTVLDTETTGLNTCYDRIVEIAAIRVRDGEVVSSFEKLLNPGIKISPSASRVNGITDSMVKNCPSFSSIKEDLLSFIGDDVLVGHNIIFDLRFINRSLGFAIDNKFIDTLSLSRNNVIGLQNYKLETLVKHFKLGNKQDHRALGDVELTHLLYQKIREDGGDYRPTLAAPRQKKTISSTAIEDVVAYIREYDSVLQDYDQMIIDYLVGRIKLKKTLIEDAPPQPKEPETSILDLYKNKLLNQDQFERLFEIEKKRRYDYQRRKTIVERIDSRTRTIRDPFSYWHEFHRDIEYEKQLIERVKEESSAKDS